MSEEKEYRFVSHREGKVGEENDRGIITVKESELTQPQKDLLLGEAIRRFNDLPPRLMDRFFDHIFRLIEKKPNPLKSQLENYMVEKITEGLKKENE